MVSQVVGHGSFNWGLQDVRVPVSSLLCILGEPILAPIYGLIYFGEAIPIATWIGAAFILPGIWLGARAELKG